jgi:hypothetical protein
MSTKNLPGYKGQPECKADNLTAICELRVSQPYGPSWPLIRRIFFLFLAEHTFNVIDLRFSSIQYSISEISRQLTHCLIPSVRVTVF